MSDKKKHILDVAERLIAKNGYRSTTTRMIAEEAEVNVAMLSYYFGSKEQLLKALLDRHTEEVKRLLEQINLRNEEPFETFRKFMFAYVDYSFENPRPVIIAIREIGLLNQRPDILMNLQETMLQVHRMIIEALEKAKKTNELRNIDVELYVLTFSSTIESYLVNAFMFDTGFPFLGIRKKSPDAMKERLKKHLSSLLSQLKINPLN
ncbi:TetR/AcrR family transcriptional regulator [Balneolales bacterium ANBcel1]|nr:TetR/AcrR family transcriptional regulator [Balneolales bacterium ANBcel1]